MVFRQVWFSDKREFQTFTYCTLYFRVGIPTPDPDETDMTAIEKALKLKPKLEFKEQANLVGSGLGPSEEFSSYNPDLSRIR